LSATAEHPVPGTSTANGYSAVSLFAGAGGMALGLEAAGFHHLMLNELNNNAVTTLRQNRPNWPVIKADMRDINFTSLHGRVDVLEGGFPCQPFSVAGKRQGFRDVRGMLFFELIRAVNEMRPKIVVGENVKGLTSHECGLTLKLMVAVLQAIGYRVAYRVLRSQYLDVPQMRERVVLLAARKDTDVPLLFPRERGYIIPLRAALADCPPSMGSQYPGWKQRFVELIPPGGSWRSLPEEPRSELSAIYRTGVPSGFGRRLSWDSPSPTLIGDPLEPRADRCHPAEPRPPTVREYARIQTFPDDWIFAGPVSAQYKQIGNAVPVNLGYHVGTAIVSMLGGACSSADFEPADELPTATRLAGGLV
jgi:DNA (cytosine-5)-methyltransferase 1